MEIYNQQQYKTFENPYIADQIEQYSHSENNSCFSLFQKVFCCSTQSKDGAIDEPAVLKKIEEMQKIALNDWKEKDAHVKYASIYHDLPKEVRRELKEIAIGNYINHYQKKDSGEDTRWMKTIDDTWKKENEKILKKIAKASILEISEQRCEEILAIYSDPLLRPPKLKTEVTSYGQKFSSCIGLFLTPFRMIAECISKIFQTIFCCCLKKSDQKNEENLKIIKEMLEILKKPNAGSMGKINALYNSLPVAVQIKLKDALIDKRLDGLIQNNFDLLFKDQETWKKQNCKTLEQIALYTILNVNDNKETVTEVLQKLIKPYSS